MRALHPFTLFIAFAALSAAALAVPYVPPAASFQGAISTAAGAPVAGPISLTLSYCDVPTGGTPLYSEKFGSVPVSRGTFQVAMGTGTRLSGASTFQEAVRGAGSLFVEVAVNGDPPMTPRYPVLSAPYAMKAQDALTVGGQSADYYLNTSATAQTKTGPLSLSGTSATGTSILSVTQSGAGRGVQGTSTLGTGVYGKTSSAASVGVYGVSDGGILSWAVYGVQNNPGGPAIGGIALGSAETTSGRAVGVFGYVGNNDAFYADFARPAGIRGETRYGDGVQGGTTDLAGVSGKATGTGGTGVLGTHAAATGIAPGVYGITASTDANASGVLGEVTGGGGSYAAGVHGRYLGTSVLGSGVYGEATSGAGVNGTSPLIGVTGSSTAAPGPGVNGIGVYGTSASSIGVYGYSTAPGGSGVYGRTIAVGTYGVLGNGPDAGIGVEGSSNFANGTGARGVNFKSGIGLEGYSYDASLNNTPAGIDVKASGNGQNTALQVSNGGIQVAGAARPAFIHQVTTTNSISNVSILDNPFCNGDPNAILIVTHNWNPGGSGGTYLNKPFGVYYDTGRGKWAIYIEDLTTITPGLAFNVLVIKQAP